MTTDLSHAQADMRHAYYGGASGMFASSLAWLVAAIVALRGSPEQAVWALLIGGMLIHPVGVAISKALGRSGSHAKTNPLGSLAGASTFWLIFMLPLAYGVSRLQVAWFFPAMLLVIGGRYLVFNTLYGMRVYWVCGLALAAAGFGLGKLGVAPAISALVGAAIEAAFAVVIFIQQRREAVAPAAPVQADA